MNTHSATMARAVVINCSEGGYVTAGAPADAAPSSGRLRGSSGGNRGVSAYVFHSTPPQGLGARPNFWGGGGGRFSKFLPARSHPLPARTHDARPSSAAANAAHAV